LIFRLVFAYVLDSTKIQLDLTDTFGISINDSVIDFQLLQYHLLLSFFLVEENFV